MIDLANYHQLQPLPTPWGELWSKAGVKGFEGNSPRLHPGLMLMLSRIPKQQLAGLHLADLTDSAGISTLTEAKVHVAGCSRASLRCAAHHAHSSKATVQIEAAASWQLSPAHYEVVLHLPASDRGTARAHADIFGCAQALVADGSAYMVLHKSQGAKRYTRYASNLFGSVEKLAEAKGWWLVRARHPLASDALAENAPPTMQHFAHRGKPLAAHVGVFAAGKLDAGSRILLASLDMTSYQAMRVLDLGCGYGILGLELAQAGAQVCALDDDLLAVLSTQHNAKQWGLKVNAKHSDLTHALPVTAHLDAVVMNPPFHLAKQMSLQLGQYFIAAAHQQLVPGGSLTLVANQALPYEQCLHADGWKQHRTLYQGQGYKVLQAYKSA